MVYSYTINAALGLVMLITFLFMLVDLDSANNDITGFAILWVFKNTVSTGGVNALGVVLTIMVFAGTVSFNISTSRQTWSFARDNGLPWSKWIAHVDKKKELPVHAIQISCGFTILMSLISESPVIPPFIACSNEKTQTLAPMSPLAPLSHSTWYR